MRALFLALSLILILGTTLFLPVALPPSDDGAYFPQLLTGAACVMLLTVPALLFGAQWQYWPGHLRHGDGSRPFRRFAIGATAVQVVGAVGIVISAWVFEFPWWIAAVEIIATAVITTGLYALAAQLQRKAPPQRPELSSGTAADDPRRLFPKAFIGGAIGFVAALGLIIALNMLIDEPVERVDLSTLAFIPLALALIGAAVPLFLPVYRMGQAVRSVTHRSFTLTQKLQQRVLKGKDVALDPTELDAADRYAVRMQPLLHVQAWMFGLIFGAQVPLQLAQLNFGDDPDLLRIGLLSIFTASVVFFVFLYGGYKRNVRRFVAERAATDTAEVSSAASTS